MASNEQGAPVWPHGETVFAVFNIHQRVQPVRSGHIHLGDGRITPTTTPLFVADNHDEAEAWRQNRLLNR